MLYVFFYVFFEGKKKKKLPTQPYIVTIKNEEKMSDPFVPAKRVPSIN